MAKRAIVLAAVAALGAGAVWMSGCGGELPPLPEPPELGHGPVDVPAAFGDGGAAPIEITVDAAAPVICDPPCDDGNPCTVNECQGGVCVYPDDTEFPVCDDEHAVCVAGACCAAPRCFDKGACVDACPAGATCNDAGVCD